jgi:hypothetical protein
MNSHDTNVWDVWIAAMPGILSFLAVIAASLSAVISVIGNRKTEENGRKTDKVESMLNSELAKFKKEAADAYRHALEQAIATTRATVEKENSSTTSSLELRILKLESELRFRNDQNAAAAPRVPNTPEERLQEIRGTQ